MKRDSISALDALRHKAARNALGFISKPAIGPNIFVKDECRALGARLRLMQAGLAPESSNRLANRFSLHFLRGLPEEGTGPAILTSH
jgi:hypothetical protein